MADSSMRNIGAVEQYGKNLANVNIMKTTSYLTLVKF